MSYTYTEMSHAYIKIGHSDIEIAAHSYIEMSKLLHSNVTFVYIECHTLTLKQSLSYSYIQMSHSYI